MRLAAALIAAASLAVIAASPVLAFGFSTLSFEQDGAQSAPQASPPPTSPPPTSPPPNHAASPTAFTTPPAHHVASDAVVVPLSNEPFAQLINPSSRVAFDFLGQGEKRPRGWLTADAGWLVWDPNWRSDVRSGADLVGGHTWSMVWSDGFAALAALDTNHDGVLTGDELGGLALWIDSNCDGVSQPSEVMPVEAHGIVAISVHGQRSGPGLQTAPNGIRFDNGESRPLYDWTPGMARRPHLF